MTKLSDAGLSLAVAKIMWPEYHEWIIDKGHVKGLRGYCGGEHRVPVYDDFNHTTDDAGFKMCVWLAGRLHRDHGARIAEDVLFQCVRGIGERDPDPHRAIAEAIVETHNG